MEPRAPLPAGPLMAEQAPSVLIRLGQRLYDRGWLPATSGNLSARVGDRVLSTGSGVDKGAMLPADLVWTDREGRVLAGSRPTSAELALHLLLYRLLPDARCVLHAHSPAATLCARRFLDQGHASPMILSGWEIQKAIEGVRSHTDTLRLPVVANDQDVPRLAAAVERVLSPMSHAWLIAGHGIYAWGRDPAAAFRHLEAWEYLLSLHATLPAPTAPPRRREPHAR